MAHGWQRFNKERGRLVIANRNPDRIDNRDITASDEIKQGTLDEVIEDTFGYPYRPLSHHLQRTAVLRRHRLSSYWDASSEACYLPAALALIPELHHKRSESLATRVHQNGIYAGIVIGGLGGGWVGQHYGWRLGFTALGIFGVCYAFALVPVLAPSHRAESRGTPNFFSTLKELLAIRGFPSIVGFLGVLHSELGRVHMASCLFL